MTGVYLPRPRGGAVWVSPSPRTPPHHLGGLPRCPLTPRSALWLHLGNSFLPGLCVCVCGPLSSHPLHPSVGGHRLKWIAVKVVLGSSPLTARTEVSHPSCLYTTSSVCRPNQETLFQLALLCRGAGEMAFTVTPTLVYNLRSPVIKVNFFVQNHYSLQKRIIHCVL